MGAWRRAGGTALPPSQRPRSPACQHEVVPRLLLVPCHAGSTYSTAGDPWPINPEDPNTPTFVGLLWQNGFEIYIEINRLSTHYVIQPIFPIYINTCLALLVRGGPTAVFLGLHAD